MSNLPPRPAAQDEYVDPLANAGKPKSLLPDALRRQWIRIFLRDLHFTDRYDRIDALYRIRDPWELQREPQRFRYLETSRLIEQHFGRVGRMLEVGCGEGHQSQRLVQVCDELVGIDISGRAVKRARTLCPSATFVTGDVFTSNLGHDARFDLVVGCEMLYYVKDVVAQLERFSELGRACLVTYYSKPASTLDTYVLAVPGVESATVRYGPKSWIVAWWRNQV